MLTIYDNDERVREELKKRGLYTLLMSYVKPVEGHHCWALGDFKDRFNGDVFLLYQGFDDPKDNGFQQISLVNGLEQERAMAEVVVRNAVGKDWKLVFSEGSS